MFYNYCRSTKSSLKNEELKKQKRKQISISHSPNQRVLNLTKRQKLKNLLMLKFIEKYNINFPDKTIENEVTKFVQGEKLTDKDLQRLNIKIQRLVRNTSANNILEQTMTKKINPQVSPQRTEDIMTELNNNNNNNLNNTLYPRNDIISLPKLNETKEDKKLQHSQSSLNIANKTFSLFPKNYNKKLFKTPEEELAELEKELEISDYHSKTKKEKRLDFSKEGNEWSAISKYKQKLYRQQLIEEKMKENEIKKRTKEELDNQIKLKLKKEYEENLREKEFNILLNEKLKKMDEIDKIKQEKIKNQFKKEKECRDKLLKDVYTRRKIEYLKEKKLDKEIVNNVKKKI